MLVMVELVLSVCGVLRFLCLPLLLRNSGVFFDCGRALRCLLPVASGRFLHLVVLYGYLGADVMLSVFRATDQLLDAALGELRVVALDQPCLIVGDFNVEPTKIPCLSKGISAALWLIWNLLGPSLLVCLLLPLVSVLGVIWEVIVEIFMVGCLL